MARISTTDNSRSIETTLTDAQAAAACRRIPANHKDASFARDIANAFQRYGANLTQNRRVWMHILGNQQIRREVPAPAPAPVAVTPVAPIVPAPTPVVPTAPVTPAMTGEELDKAADGLALTMLMYDIPSVADIDNPSAFLHTRGLRINKSVWIVPTGSVPHHLIAELRAVGSIVLTAPYDAAASRGLLEAAINFANGELAAAQKRAEASVKLAADKMNNGHGDPTRKRNTYMREVAAVAQRLNDLAARIETGANVFGVRGGVALAQLRNAAQTLGVVTAARSTVYAAAATVLEEIGTVDSKAIAAGMRADEVMPAVAAGMLEDCGNDEAAHALAAAFSEPETFSLVGTGEDD